jgi:hypothetical protein
MCGMAFLTASTIGGTSTNKNGISDIKVHTKVLIAPINGIGVTTLEPGSVKNWLQTQTPTPIIILPINRLKVDTNRYLRRLYSFKK